jgi:hypothetical protein
LFEKKFVYSKPKENVWELPLDFEKFYDWFKLVTNAPGASHKCTEFKISLLTLKMSYVETIS